MGLANRDKGLKKLCMAIQPLGIGHEPYWILKRTQTVQHLNNKKAGMDKILKWK